MTNAMPATAGRTVESLAASLLDAHASHRAGPHPDPSPVASQAEAYAVQAALLPHLGARSGWKVGRKAPDAPPARGPLLDSRIYDSGVTLPRDAFHVWKIEAELVFHLEQDLPARDAPFARDEVLAAIGRVSAGFEIVDSRFAQWPDVPPLLMLADLQSHGAMVIGSGIRVAAEPDFLAAPVRLTVDDRVVVEQQGGNPAGDIIELAVWLANHLAATEGGLRAGDLVTTGSYTGMTELLPGQRAEASFAGIGRVAVTRAT